jgi:PHD/YefM family antitoxin component YafN of YafNO toxin-antitoxin module
MIVQGGKSKIKSSKRLTKQSFFCTINILDIFRRVFMNVNLKEDVKPISYIKTNAADMMDYINEHKNPIIVTQRGEARGVLMDIESYQGMINAFSIMKLLQISEKAIQDGKVYDNEAVFSEIRKKTGRKK